MKQTELSFVRDEDLKLSDLTEGFGCEPDYIYWLMGREGFPTPRQFCANAHLWDREKVMEWLERKHPAKQVPKVPFGWDVMH